MYSFKLTSDIGALYECLQGHWQGYWVWLFSHLEANLSKLMALSLGSVSQMHCGGLGGECPSFVAFYRTIVNPVGSSDWLL